MKNTNLTQGQIVELESIIGSTEWSVDEKAAKLEDLTNEMIEILLIDLTKENATKDSQTITFKHYNNKIMNGLIREARPKFLADWAADIIRDEAYATVYEAMKIVSEDMNMDEIEFDNPAFIGPVYKMAINKMKERLIPASKRSGEFKNVKEIPFSPIKDDENTITIEDILEGSDINVLMGSKKEKMNQFLNWFENNKKDILTKNQLKFIGNDNHKEKSNASHTRKRISERVSKAYKEQYGEVSPRIANLMDQERILEWILEEKDFRSAYIKYRDEDFIIDAITDHVALNYLQAFNKGSDNQDTIKAIRIALFKKLGEVISTLEAAK